MTPPYKRIHVVINPASGKGQPMLKYLADLCKQYDVEWDISLTKRYGDATQQAKDALARGVDLVVGHGGDGTLARIRFSTRRRSVNVVKTPAARSPSIWVALTMLSRSRWPRATADSTD